MQKTQICPICGARMRSLKLNNKYYPFISKKSNFIEMTCTMSNHCIQVIVDSNTDKVDLLKVSLLPDYSRFLYVDFFNEKCKVVCYKNGKEQEINIPKLLEIDFPELINLKNKISTYILFS